MNDHLLVIVGHASIAFLVRVEIVDIRSCTFRYLSLFGAQIMLGLEGRLIEECSCFLVAPSNQTFDCLKASNHVNVQLSKLKL